MEKNTWFIGDHHFGHKDILDYGPRPFKTIEDHNDALVEIHNAVVKPEDTVWFMGDVAFGRENLKYIRFMDGIKNLILGNHDTYPIMDYVEAGFNKIQGMVRYKEFVLTHMPVHPAQLYRYMANIHGHLHDHNIDDCRYINVNMDIVDGYAPVNFRTIRAELNIKLLNLNINGDVAD